MSLKKALFPQGKHVFVIGKSECLFKGVVEMSSFGDESTDEANADPGNGYYGYGGYRGYYGHARPYYKKRSAEADATAKAAASRGASPEAEADSTEATASRKGFLKVPEAKRYGRYGYPVYGGCPWYYYGCGMVWWGKK